MNAASMLVALATYGVSFGWQPLPDGNTEYIVQVEPALAEAMIRKGDVISSVIPPEVQGVRRFRIQVGNEQLPRVTAPKSSARRTGAEQPLPEYTGYQRFASDAAPDDEHRRWIMPDFTVPPDDPATSRGPLEPYRPVTPGFAGESTPRTRGFDVDSSTSSFGTRSPALGAETVASIHGKPAITKADTNKVTPVMAATNAATPIAVTDPAKQPWLPLTFTALLLFASLGANMYLGWLARDYYLRYREIVADDGPAMI